MLLENVCNCISLDRAGCIDKAGCIFLTIRIPASITLCQYIVYGREQLLEHPSSNGLAIKGIYLPIHAVCSVCITLLGMKILGYHNWPLNDCSFLSALRFLRICNIQQECNDTKVTNLWLPMSCLEQLYLHNDFASPKSIVTIC